MVDGYRQLFGIGRNGGGRFALQAGRLFHLLHRAVELAG
jgi:hypothetical protein